jgi:hypothetical protein
MKVVFPVLPRRSLFKEAPVDKPAPKKLVSEKSTKPPEAIQKLREVVASPSDCSNPDCPYRAEVETRKAKHRDRVSKWRKGAKP